MRKSPDNSDSEGRSSRPSERQCIVVENGVRCTEPWLAHKMCVKHHGRWRRNGDPLVVLNSRGRPLGTFLECKVPDCPDRASGLGYCSRHYDSFKRYGDPLAMLTWEEELERRHAHKVARDARGCEVCGEPIFGGELCQRHYMERWNRARGVLPWDDWFDDCPGLPDKPCGNPKRVTSEYCSRCRVEAGIPTNDIVRSEASSYFVRVNGQRYEDEEMLEAIRECAKEVKGDPTITRYDELRPQHPHWASSGTIAKRFNGYSEAKVKAGFAAPANIRSCACGKCKTCRNRKRLLTVRRGTHVSKRVWRFTQSECLVGLLAAALDLGLPISETAYAKWRKDKDPLLIPSMPAIIRKFAPNGWSNAHAALTVILEELLDHSTVQ